MKKLKVARFDLVIKVNIKLYDISKYSKMYKKNVMINIFFYKFYLIILGHNFCYQFLTLNEFLLAVFHFAKKNFIKNIIL